ncbi:MAG: transketolase [Deltaproteobacteria bacterium]|nr:transketolase [Deltaproteobacteria bacterium]
MLTNNSLILSKKIRKKTLEMVHKSKASHVGSCFSMADIISVLYTTVLRISPADIKNKNRDRFILSKGHAAAIMYALLGELDFFPKEELDTYCEDGSRLMGHISHYVPGVEVSTGSLGHGLPIACGMALAGKADSLDYRVFTLVSDGELDEGSNWEAILFAPHQKLDNLILIVDYNKIQSFGTVKDVLDLEPLKSKFESFGWVVKEIDGHSHKEIEDVFKLIPFNKGKPSVVIAHTVKGKGVSFMEDKLEWHYKSPNIEQLEKALKELDLQ